jgi:large subunit ribosomal protein L25
MAKQVTIQARKRTAVGSSRVKQLRKQGVTPAILYGPHHPPEFLQVGEKQLEGVIHGAFGQNVLVDLQIEADGKTVNRLALLKDVQQHPVEDTILHVDFYEVSMTEKLRTAVAVHSVGEPEGVKTGGGVLEHVMRELHVECLPKDLPEVINVDVSALQVGQSLRVGDIQPPTGVTFLDDKEQAVFIVAAPVAEEELAPSTEMVEPEVIGAKKEEGEEEGEEAAAKTEAGKAKPATAGKPETAGAAKGGEAKAATPPAKK